MIFRKSSSWGIGLATSALLASSLVIATNGTAGAQLRHSTTQSGQAKSYTSYVIPTNAEFAKIKKLKPETTVLTYQHQAAQINFAELADALGYLGPLKLDDVGTVLGGPADIQATATGQTDFSKANNVAIVDLLETGAQVKAVFEYEGIQRRTASGYYVLDSSGITQASQLIGKTAGVNALAAGAQADIDQYLDKNGLRAEASKLALVVLPTADENEALENGQIQLASLTPAEAAEDGNVRELFNEYNIYGTFDDGSVIMTDSFIQNNPNTVKIFVAACARAVRYTQTHTLSEIESVYFNWLAANGHAADIPQFKTTGFPGMGVNAVGGVVTAHDFSFWIGWLKGQGKLPVNLVARDLYTNEFNPYAPANS